MKQLETYLYSMPQEEIYLTTKEAMKTLKISRTTLHRWKKKGIVKAKKIGTIVRFKLSDIEKIMK